MAKQNSCSSKEDYNFSVNSNGETNCILEEVKGGQKSNLQIKILPLGRVSNNMLIIMLSKTLLSLGPHKHDVIRKKISQVKEYLLEANLTIGLQINFKHLLRRNAHKADIIKESNP